MAKSSLQQRIAVRFIVSTALLTMLLCTIMLICFWFVTDAIPVGESLNVGDVRHIFFQMLGCCCVVDAALLVLLFLVARRMARDSIRPVTDIIDTASSITHTTLDVRIPLPKHQDELYELAYTVNGLLARVSTAMEREKSFTSYASHEFRTPLSVLKGRMEILIRKPRTEEEYTKHIKECIGEVDKLNNMVEQLLLLARCESGRLQLKFSTLRLSDVVETTASRYSDVLLCRQLSLGISIQPEDVAVITDEQCFFTIINNLLSNAVKYADEGGKIAIEAHKTDEALHLSVSNTGVGLTVEQLSHVFDKFYRSHDKHVSETKGFGLGLPIVKQCCEMLNIKLRIDSDKEKTTVLLVMPKEPWQNVIS